MYFSGWKGRNGSGLDRELPLDRSTLPFALGGELTFGVGVNLKMAATRWTEWAADIGLRNDKGSPEEGCVPPSSDTKMRRVDCRHHENHHRVTSRES